MKKLAKYIFQIILVAALTLSLIPQRDQSVSAQNPAQANLPVSFQIADAAEDNLEILLSAPSYQMDEIQIEGKTFDHILVPNTVNSTAVGQYQLPIASKLIGVPPQAEIRLEIIKVTAQELPGEYQISKAPFPLQSDELDTSQQWDYSLDFSLEKANQEGLSSPVRIVEDAWIRDQRVVRLAYSPFEFSAETGKLVWYPKVSVKVHFEAPFGITEINQAAPQTNDSSSPFSAMLESSLLNYEQAKIWRGTESFASSRIEHTTENTTLDLGSRYRIGIEEDGIYTLSYEALKAANSSIDTIDPRQLQMSSQGKDVGIYIVGEGDGSFDPGDYIVFYGQRFYGDYLGDLYQDENRQWQVYPRQNTDGSYYLWQPEFNAIMLEKYTHENVYWLSVGSSNGLRMATVDGNPSGNSSSPVAHYRETVRAEEQNLWSTIRFAGEESWFWEKITQGGTPFPYQATVTDRSTDGPLAIIRAEFVSGSNALSVEGFSHRTKVSFNSVEYSDFYWSGKSRYVYEHELNAGTIDNGTNTFEIEATTLYDFDSKSLPISVYIDWFEIEYNRNFVAEDNAITFTSPETGLQKYQVSGFTNTANLWVLDITDPLVPRRVLNPLVATSEVMISLTHSDLSVAMAAGGKSVSQDQVSYYEPPDWSSMSNGVDYVFITHANFWDATQNLAAYRAGTGLSTMTIDVQDLYNEFFYGIYNPIAIKYFLAYTFENWQTAPTYALLIGDGHFNFHNYNLDEYGATDLFMPPNLAWVDPWQGEVDSSSLLATIVGDDVFPDLFIARLPVNSSAEVNAYLSKLTAYEGATYSGSWEQNHMFITQNPDAAGDFDQFAEDIIEEYVDPYSFATPLRLYQTAYGCYSANSAECNALTQDIKDTINDTGTLIVSYIGHASVGYWSNDTIFTIEDIPDLTNSGQMPVILSMTCLDGYWNFTSEYVGSSLIEEMVRSDDAGAIAAFSPTGLGVSNGHDVLHKGFYDSLMMDGNWEMGAAAHKGKLWLYQSGTHYDLIKTYTIYGDPALQINSPYRFTLSPTENETITMTPGATVTHTLTVENTGILADSYEIAANKNWETNFPSSIPEIAPGSSVQIPVEVTVPLQYAISDTAYITVTSVNNQGISLFAELTTTIPLVYGFETSPAESSLLLPPNSQIDHTITLTNTGLLENSYALSIIGNTWETSLPGSTTEQLISGEVIQLPITVKSPDSIDVSDQVTLTISQINGLSQVVTILLTTRVPGDFEFTVSPTSISQSVAPGSTTNFIIDIQNTGLQFDQYKIEVIGNTWETILSTDITNQLDFLESEQIQLSVIAPTTNTPETMTIRITSVSVPSTDIKEIPVQLTISTTHFGVFLPLIHK